jgi:ferritin-like metal-binding protein YciE
MQSLHELFLTELRDIYNAENQLLKALPKMAEAARDPELRQSLLAYSTQTRQQLQRLEQVFEIMDKDPWGEACEAMEGLLGDGEEILAMQYQAEPSVLDAGLIAIVQKVKHYEMASYDTLCVWADMMGYRELKQLLQQTLKEEIATHQQITDIALHKVNPEALQMSGISYGKNIRPRY